MAGSWRAAERADLTVLLDTNVLIRHLTGNPPEMATRATRFLATETELVLADVVLAECVYVLQSVYEVDRPRIAELMRAALAMPSVLADTYLFLRALEVYELERLDFAEAYLVARAELTGHEAIASFDKAIGRVGSVRRLVP
jgi:predicted nucleic-acid-binding protein